MDEPRDLSWILNHLGEDRSQQRGAVAPPIYQTSNFCFPNVAAMRVALADELQHPFYTRGNNPTVELLRRKLAALEGAEDCLVFGSGSAAIAAAVIQVVKTGDEVVCVSKPYTWTRKLLSLLMPRLGVTTHFVHARDVREIKAKLRENTSMIVLESPNSLTFEQQDLSAIAQLARDRQIVSLCDNSFASPLHQSPLAHGIDLVAHSGTKYINGHSDVVVGVLCGSAARIRDVFRGPYMTLGAILSPHDAWLVLRGLRTLPVRMRQTAETSTQVIDFLRAHPRVARVFWPHAPEEPQAALTARQLRAPSGLMSIQLRNPQHVETFCDRLQRFLLACSWGGYESLAMPILESSKSASFQGAADGLPAGLVRLSIGLEDASVLIEDLRQALDALSD